ncbi:MAG: HpcH/HpaI aldolase/citrate lyase family protein [Burkholderiaceae bacterium]|nr:HpcH/HpaI aldolase/citrate lyase family protein [Burkholderiaceae bacterium]
MANPHCELKPALGASLYVPTTHKDLLAIANGDKLGQLRSVIFCLEDAIAERDLSYALFNLSLALRNMSEQSGTLRFARVRNPEVLGRVLAMPGAHKLTGFVLPKTTRRNFDAYFGQLAATPHLLMPTLETAEVFDDDEMKRLRKLLSAPKVRPRILALRIGGNDLLALLGLRRPATGTIYQTALGQVIGRLVTTFRPHGFQLSAPVFEHIAQRDWLDAEVAQDLAHGLVAKTAIHPEQVAQIERHYQVAPHDVDLALRIVDPEDAAVFRERESMCEAATHHPWALQILERACQFGMRQPDDNINKWASQTGAPDAGADVEAELGIRTGPAAEHDADLPAMPAMPAPPARTITDQGETRS